jgi:acyl-CoA thioesterase-1
MKLLLLFSILTLQCLPVSGTEKNTASARHLIIIGDSLTEGYGVAKSQAYPALLEKLIAKSGKKNWRVTNSGVSGSTSASAVGRVRWILQQKPDLVILALGANDGLRGQPPANLEKNLNEAIALLRQAKVPVVIAGMKMPPNYGAKFRKDFEDVFVRLARRDDITSIPFLLEGVAGQRQYNQADGIHPNEAGHKIIADTVFAAIEGAL